MVVEVGGGDGDEGGAWACGEEEEITVEGGGGADGGVGAGGGEGEWGDGAGGEDLDEGGWVEGWGRRVGDRAVGEDPVGGGVASDGEGGDGVGYGHAIAGDASEDGEALVLVVEVVGVVGETDEELAGGGVRVRAEFGHGDGAAGVGDFGFVDDGGLARDGRSACCGFVAAALEDEAGDAAVDDGVGVVAAGDVAQEVSDGGRGGVWVVGEVDGAGIEDDAGGLGDVRVGEEGG